MSICKIVKNFVHAIRLKNAKKVIEKSLTECNSTQNSLLRNANYKKLVYAFFCYYSLAEKPMVDFLSSLGIRYIETLEGKHIIIDVAVREDMRRLFKSYYNRNQERFAKEIHADGWEIDYHRNPRPSHADIGGRQFVIGAAREINGVWFESFEEKAEPLLKEYGCQHFKMPIICGINTPTYSPEELAELKEMDKQTIEFEGKEYTGYEATQMQRSFEEDIRNAKDRHTTAILNGDIALAYKEQDKIDILMKEYKRYSHAMNLRCKFELLKVTGYHRLKKPKNYTVDKKQYEQYKKKLKELVPNSLEEFQKLKYSMPQEWNFLKQQYRKTQL